MPTKDGYIRSSVYPADMQARQRNKIIAAYPKLYGVVIDSTTTHMKDASRTDSGQSVYRSSVYPQLVYPLSVYPLSVFPLMDPFY